jgi:hypothetical protein
MTIISLGIGKDILGNNVMNAASSGSKAAMNAVKFSTGLVVNNIKKSTEIVQNTVTGGGGSQPQGQQQYQTPVNTPVRPPGQSSTGKPPGSAGGNGLLSFFD